MRTCTWTPLVELDAPVGGKPTGRWQTECGWEHEFAGDATPAGNDYYCCQYCGGAITVPGDPDYEGDPPCDS